MESASRGASTLGRWTARNVEQNASAWTVRAQPDTPPYTMSSGRSAKRRVFGTVAPEVTELPTGPALRYNNVTEKDMARKLPGAA
jgi:hypothetical protein